MVATYAPPRLGGRTVFGALFNRTATRVTHFDSEVLDAVRVRELQEAIPGTRWNASVRQAAGRWSLLGRVSYYAEWFDSRDLHVYPRRRGDRPRSGVFARRVRYAHRRRPETRSATTRRRTRSPARREIATACTRRSAPTARSTTCASTTAGARACNHGGVCGALTPGGDSDEEMGIRPARTGMDTDAAGRRRHALARSRDCRGARTHADQGHAHLYRRRRQDARRGAGGAAESGQPADDRAVGGGAGHERAVPAQLAGLLHRLAHRAAPPVRHHAWRGRARWRSATARASACIRGTSCWPRDHDRPGPTFRAPSAARTAFRCSCRSPSSSRRGRGASRFACWDRAVSGCGR